MGLIKLLFPPFTLQMSFEKQFVALVKMALYMTPVIWRSTYFHHSCVK